MPDVPTLGSTEWRGWPYIELLHTAAYSYEAEIVIQPVPTRGEEYLGLPTRRVSHRVVPWPYVRWRRVNDIEKTRDT
jgi:hypothetical protein